MAKKYSRSYAGIFERFLEGEGRRPPLGIVNDFHDWMCQRVVELRKSGSARAVRAWNDCWGDARLSEDQVERLISLIDAHVQEEDKAFWERFNLPPSQT